MGQRNKAFWAEARLLIRKYRNLPFRPVSIRTTLTDLFIRHFNDHPRWAK